MRTSDFDYHLPEELIARYPLPKRDGARMMVLHRSEQRIEHRHVAEFPELIAPGDLVVLNDTRVVPAQVRSDDGRVGLLFLEAVGDCAWKCLVKPGRRMRAGAEIFVGGIRGEVLEICEEGERIIRFERPVDLDAVGEMPIPPYLDRPADDADKERYQTVFAQMPGAVAAPTAGLHFTPEMLRKMPHAFVTLHVGLGTFRPVQTDDLAEHRMHSERFSVSEENAERINAAQRIVAIGTTTTRVLESLGRPLAATRGSTDIFIHPPYRFRAVDALLTNFHLPKSTLLMLLSAFAGREFVQAAYEEAIREHYRFFSYGDCMLVL